ncbi:MAG TPA: type III pantothenate kinase [Bacteroidales bacterium]|nr:type III pantothenate kinase [Bacteroidales bacterium]
MFRLIFDIGNTNLKLYVFHNQKILRKQVLTSDAEAISFLDNIEFKSKISFCIVSKVREVSEELNQYLLENYSVFFLNSDLILPYKIKYNTPETLGQDRMASVAGASVLFPGANALIIDAGTAITYDFLFNGSIYFGGTISPGIGIRFRSLNTFTGKLPLLNIDMDKELLFGQTTNDAIIIGVQNGILHEVRGVIESYQKKYKDIVVILTGGYSFFFEKLLKNRIFAAPDLIAVGLNKILELNVKEN